MIRLPALFTLALAVGFCSAKASASTQVEIPLTELGAFEATVAHSTSGARGCHTTLSDRPLLGIPPAKKGALLASGKGPDIASACEQALQSLAQKLDAFATTPRTTNTRTSGSVPLLSNGGFTDQPIGQQLLGAIGREVRVIHGYQNPSTGVVQLTLSLDTDQLATQTERIAEVAKTKLRQTSERVQARIDQTQTITGADLRRLSLGLRAVRTLGKSELGRIAKDEWKEEDRTYRRVLKTLANCVQLDEMTHNDLPLLADDAPLLTEGDALSVRLTCENKPIVNSKMRVIVSGGLVQIPETARTDQDGRIHLKVGTAFGSEVDIGFVHDLEGVEGAFWLADLKPRRDSTFSAIAPQPARMTLSIDGGTTDERAHLQERFAGFAASQWGAQIVSSNAHLHTQLTYSPGSPRVVREQTIWPVALHVQTRFAQGSDNLIADTLRGGGLASTAEEAQSRGLNNALMRLSRLKRMPIMDHRVRGLLACSFPEAEQPPGLHKQLANCIQWVHDYAAEDKAAIEHLASQRLDLALIQWAMPRSQPGTAKTIDEAKRQRVQSREHRQQCDGLLKSTKEGGLLATTLSPHCNRLTATDEAIESDLHQLIALKEAEEEAARQAEEAAKAAEAQREAEAKQAEAERLAQAKLARTCVATCRLSWAEQSPKARYSVMRTVADECLVRTFQGGYTRNGCLTEAVQFCAQSCMDSPE